MIKKQSNYVARAGIIAAIYAATTLLCLLVLQGLAWGPIQFRLSEAVCVFAVLSAPAVPGLTIGCIIANLINVAISGSGALGMLDVIFGSLATLLGALWCRHFRARPALALFGFVLTNALIVPAYLPILLQGMGYYTIPFTTISLDGVYPLMYLFGAIATGIGESIVIYALGMPLLHALRANGIGDDKEESHTAPGTSTPALHDMSASASHKSSAGTSHETSAAASHESSGNQKAPENK
jgi:uncharacterized membrane protein